MFYRAPDTVLYAQQRVAEIKQRPAGRVLYATERAGQSIYQSIRENLISDYTLKDVAARAVAEINPLLAAMIPEQHQINEALQALKSGISFSNEYLEETVELQAQQIDALEELKNLQQISVEKLDTLEAIAEGRYEPPLAKHRQEVAKETGKVAYTPAPVPRAVESEPEVGTEEKPITVAISEEVSEEQKNFQERQLEQLELIRANLESLNSYLTGSEQFGLAGLVDRIFNKYTAFLNRHPAFRAIHTLATGFAKIRLGITKPGQIRGLVTSSIKKFLGIGEEGPLQQLVSIAGGQLDIQYKIYNMLRDQFKKTESKYKLSEDTLKLFAKSPDEIIDEKIEQFLSKIPVLNKLDEFKQRVEQKVKAKTERISIFGAIGAAPPTMTLSASMATTIPFKIRKPSSENIKPIIEITDEIKQALKEQQKVTDKFIAIGDIIERKAEDILGEKLLRQNIQRLRLDKIEKLTPENVKQLRYTLGEKARTPIGETAIGLTSFMFPILPSLIQLSAGNYKLAGRELIYTVPVVGHALTARNLLKVYKEYGDQLKFSNIKQLPKIGFQRTKELGGTIWDRFPRQPIIERTTPAVESLREKYATFKQSSVIGDIASRTAFGKLAEGALDKKFTTFAWGAAGIILPWIYYPIESIKFTVSKIWEGIKHPIKTWNFAIDTLKNLSIAVIKLPDLMIRGFTTGVQKALTAPLRTGQFLAKLFGMDKAHKYLKMIADRIVFLRKDIINAIPRAITKALTSGINKIADLLKDLTILKMGWEGLKSLGGGLGGLLNFLPFGKLKFPKKLGGLGKVLGGATRFLGKGAKIGLKKLPLVGALAGGAFAIHKLFQGDLKGAGLELASGLASLIPGIGTVASFAIDAYNESRQVEPVNKIDTDSLLNRKQELELNKSRQSIPERYSEVKEALKENVMAVKESANIISSNVSNAINNIVNNYYGKDSDDDLRIYRMQPVIIKP